MAGLVVGACASVVLALRWALRVAEDWDTAEDH